MKSSSISSLFLTIQDLPESARNEVADFAAFLVERRKSVPIQQKKLEHLIDVSTWDESSLSEVTNASEAINKWNIQKL
jgi:hypothetical protein